MDEFERDRLGEVCVAVERWKNSVACVSASASSRDEKSFPADLSVLGTVDTAFSSFSLSAPRFVAVDSKSECRAMVKELNMGFRTNLLAPYIVAVAPVTE